MTRRLKIFLTLAQKYKQGTLHMVDSLRLDDVTPLNPDNIIVNTLEPVPAE